MRRYNKRGGVVSVDKVRGGSSLPLSILLSRTLVRADPSLGFWSPQRVMTMDRSLAVGNGAVIGAGTVLEISFWRSLDLLITDWTLTEWLSSWHLFFSQDWEREGIAPSIGKGMLVIVRQLSLSGLSNKVGDKVLFVGSQSRNILTRQNPCLKNTTTGRSRIVTKYPFSRCNE